MAIGRTQALSSLFRRFLKGLLVSVRNFTTTTAHRFGCWDEGITSRRVLHYQFLFTLADGFDGDQFDDFHCFLLSDDGAGMRWRDRRRQMLSRATAG